MIAPWVMEEIRGVDRPTLSIPTAGGSHAEMTAADRFFDNDKATLDRMRRSGALKARTWPCSYWTRPKWI